MVQLLLLEVEEGEVVRLHRDLVGEEVVEDQTMLEEVVAEVVDHQHYY